MSTRLVILGFLRGRPLYGYEIKQLIEHVMGDWTNIAFGSIYFALKQLAKDGFVDKVGTEQEGSRPSRTVYQITDAGRQEFMRLLREVWQTIDRQTFVIDIGLSFMGALPIDEVKGYMGKQVAHLEHVLRYLDAHQADELASDSEMPTRLVSAIFDHHRRHLETELAWLQDLREDVEQGVFDDELVRTQGFFEGHIDITD
ncbi:MAG: PadR family transcriptional regulator [Anaerolineae bacterium]|nr:PadR family transcriptional regulator [Anaerolineae bacterium]